MPATTRAQQQSTARTLIETSTSFRGWGGRGDWHGGRLKVPSNPRKKPSSKPPFSSRKKPVKEGRDDAPSLGLGKTGLKFARMNSKEAFNPAKGGQSDAKWVTSLKLRAHLAGEKPSAKMQSRDAVGKVPRAMKGVGEQITAEQVVAKLLE